MKTLNYVVLVLVAFGLVVPVDAQVRNERDAYRDLSRAVQSVQFDQSPQQITDARRAIQRAYSVHERQERRRNELEADVIRSIQRMPLFDTAAAALDLCGAIGTYDTRMTANHRSTIRAQNRLAEALGLRPTRMSYGQSWQQLLPLFTQQNTAILNARLRFNRAAVDAIRDAAEVIARLDPSILGTRANQMRLRFENANMAAIRLQGRLIGLDGGLRNWQGRATGYGDGPSRDTLSALSELVNATVAIADAMVRQQRANIQAQQDFIQAEQRIEQEQQQEQVEALQQQRQAAEQLRSGVPTTMDEFNRALSSAMWEARDAANAVASSYFYEDAHPHHDRGGAAVARAYSLINGTTGFVPTGNYRQFRDALRTLSRTLDTCPSKPRRQR